jgi:hypothetical protein
MMTLEMTQELQKIHEQLRKVEYDRLYLLAEQADYYGEYVDQLYCILNDSFHEI